MGDVGEGVQVEDVSEGDGEELGTGGLLEELAVLEQ